MYQEFVQEMHDTIRGMIEEIHTAIPGEIVAFDADKGLATVRPIMKYRKPDGESIDYPNISGVPVVIPQASGQAVTIAFPIKSGDGCLLIVSEQSLDLWQYGQETATDLKYDLTNAICIPGLFSKPSDALKLACSENAAVIDTGGTRLAVKNGSVQIDAATITLNGNVSVNGNFTTSGGIVNLN